MSHSIQGIRRSGRDGLGLCAMLAMICLAVGANGAVAADKDKPKGQEISRVIAKEMTAAQKAMQASQWSEMLKNLEAAESKPGLTTYDKKSIYSFKAFAYLKMSNYKAAQAALEGEIATGGDTPEEVARNTKSLFQLAATNGSAKALEYGKTVADSGGASPNDFLIMAQLYYQQKDCKNSAVWSDKALAAFRKAGEAPKEVLYQIKLQCASDAGDSPAMAATLYDLIRLTNKTNYWNSLLRVERQDERDDHNTLMIYRLMYDTKSMNADTDYIEMAQLLGDAALPGEAASVLDAAMASSLMKDEHKERTTRLSNALKTRADTDKKSIAQLDADAAKSPTGNAALSAGEVHFALGDYQAAITSINLAIQKGQLKHPDEAYVYLGRSQVALKNNADAKKAFSQLKTAAGVSPRVAKLWDLYGETLGH
jgi:tetratricopeptide (TPR) repeat protein